MLLFVMLSVPDGAVVLRFFWPPRLSAASGAGRTLVFATSDDLSCPVQALGRQVPCALYSNPSECPQDMM